MYSVPSSESLTAGVCFNHSTTLGAVSFFTAVIAVSFCILRARRLSFASWRFLPRFGGLSEPFLTFLSKYWAKLL
jgi:hypothetical protein